MNIHPSPILHQFLAISKISLETIRLSIASMGNLLSLFGLCFCVLGLLHASFSIGHGVATTSGENKVGVLFLELGEVLLSGPYPG
jgi:hypothetical protein